VTRSTDPDAPARDGRVVRRALLSMLVPALLAAMPSPSAAAAPRPAWLIPPVDAPISARFEEPSSDYGPGHRGIDYAAPTGSKVRAAGDGTVTFAGAVAGVDAVTVDHGGGLESTYSDLGRVIVTEGASVGQGSWLGTVGTAHGSDEPGLHFGVKLRDRYIDPAAYLGPTDVTSALHLAPLQAQPFRDPGMPASFVGVFTGAGDHRRRCSEPSDMVDAPGPPNDNVAVAVAGIGSRTLGRTSADMYEYGPELLGYPPERIYRFSYAGTGGPRLHDPYRDEATFGDLRDAARKLGALLERVAKRHPGAAVDILAHSQGGIVARTFLASTRAWDPVIPRVEHLVTFATPHKGSPLAGAARAMENGPIGERLLVDSLSALTRDHIGLPGSGSTAVTQLAPGSDLLDGLAREDVAFGTRALALAIPNDLLVPADRARWEGERNRVVAPTGGPGGHSGIVRSAMARALAHSFLRDGAPSCTGEWDAVGPSIGAAISALETAVPDSLETAGAWVTGRVDQVARPVGRLLRHGVARLWRARG
jgi:hypothetical protein